MTFKQWWRLRSLRRRLREAADSAIRYEREVEYFREDAAKLAAELRALHRELGMKESNEDPIAVRRYELNRQALLGIKAP